MYRLFFETPMTEEIAIEHFGFVWMSWIGVPVRGTPGYAERLKVRVRQLMSPEQMQLPGWKDHFSNPRNEARAADGSEPLAYAYCSSACNVAQLPSMAEAGRKWAMEIVPQLFAELDRCYRETASHTCEDDRDGE